jgi:hypothetical protein
MSVNVGKPVEASDALGQAQENLNINTATEERPPPPLAVLLSTLSSPICLKQRKDCQLFGPNILQP